jgi:hypothetical protein
LQVVVEYGDRHGERHGNLATGLGDEREVAAQQRALGEDGERRAALGERGDHAGHEAVAAFGALVGVGVGAECHRGDDGALRAQLFRQHFGDVDLDDDLVVEVFAGVEFEVGVGVAGEAVDARVAAPTVRIDRPGERHGVARARNMVERGLREHLVKGDAREFGGLHAAHDVAQFGEPRERVALLDVDRLAVPPHRPTFLMVKCLTPPFEHTFEWRRKCRVGI